MTQDAAIHCQPQRIPLPIFGVPFDPVSTNDALRLIEQMVQSRESHYVVTANVDFVVQAQSDLELRRILFDADLVLCDGTPLIWVSRLLGRPLPERVAGSDVVPLLLDVAARKRYRVFLLGATPDSASRAVENLNRRHPDLPVAGHYSPPFRNLLEMDHGEIATRIRSAAPDLLLVSFGCPKQEKWVAMHARALGVPVSIGVGATIDFLAGHVRRAPAWMQRSGTEWVYRLAQEPRRLFKRYTRDLAVFGARVIHSCFLFPPGALAPQVSGKRPDVLRVGDLDVVVLPPHFTRLAPDAAEALVHHVCTSMRHCVVDCGHVERIHPNTIGLLVRLQKVLKISGRFLVLARPTRYVTQALKFLRLDTFFHFADDTPSARTTIERRVEERHRPVELAVGSRFDRLIWRGEITAANAARVWSDTRAQLTLAPRCEIIIDLAGVRFLDSSGVDVMLRARRFADRAELSLRFENLSPEVRNVLTYSRMDDTLMAPGQRTQTQPVALPKLPQARPA